MARKRMLYLEGKKLEKLLKDLKRLDPKVAVLVESYCGEVIEVR